MQPDSTLKAKIVGDRGKGFKKSLDEKEKNDGEICEAG